MGNNRPPGQTKRQKERRRAERKQAKADRLALRRERRNRDQAPRPADHAGSEALPADVGNLEKPGETAGEAAPQGPPARRT